MINSELIGFECRVSQPYSLPTPELTRFVNGVEFTNCFRSDAGLFLIVCRGLRDSGLVAVFIKQSVYGCEPTLKRRINELLAVLKFEELRNLS